MRGKKWSSSLVVLALLFGTLQWRKKTTPLSILQKPRLAARLKLQRTLRIEQARQVRRRWPGKPRSTRIRLPISRRTSLWQGLWRCPKISVPTAQPFVEDFPPEPNEVEVVRPHGALPVILNPDSPYLDRLVRREDIQPTPEDYIIGEEDVLTVTVWKEKDISGTVVVRPDGKITVPLSRGNHCGRDENRGSQLQKLLEEKLQAVHHYGAGFRYRQNQISSRKIYLIGQVVREGVVPINGSMTVLQVLAGAGWIEGLREAKIYVLRQAPGPGDPISI